MKLGYSPFDAPTSGAGPFRQLFNHTVNLSAVHDMSDCDAIVLWGGADISPSIYGEKRIAGSGPDEPSHRDIFEVHLIREAVRLKIPIIGVCRGAQLLCAMAGGKLIQNVDGHQTNHWITTFDNEKFFVTSAHHQMMFPFDAKHDLLAWSSKPEASKYDGLTSGYTLKEHYYDEPEVVYFPEIRGLGIQCHPEWHPQKDAFNDWLLVEVQRLFFNSKVTT